MLGDDARTYGTFQPSWCAEEKEERERLVAAIVERTRGAFAESLVQATSAGARGLCITPAESALCQVGSRDSWSMLRLLVGWRDGHLRVASGRSSSARHSNCRATS